MRGKRPYFDLSRGRLSGAGGSLAPNACATSMISGFGGPPDPRVILTPLVVSTCAAEAAGVAGIWLTLAVASGASSFRGTGKTSTLATANGWPLTGKSGRGSITRPTAITRIAATVATPLVGRLSRTASADPAPATKPSGSSSSSHTSVDASRSERLRVANQPCPSLFSAARRRYPMQGARVFLPIFSPDTSRSQISPSSISATQPVKHCRWPAI
jgi:hypothetical protein